MRQYLLLFVKLAVSLGALALIVRSLDLEEVWTTVQGVEPAWLALAVALMFIATPILGLRWRAAAHCIGFSLDPSRAVRYTFIGLFFNQVLPTSFGGDGFRIWLLLKDKEAAGKAVHSVLLDRISALIVLGIMIGLFLPALASFMPTTAFGALAVTSGSVIVGLLVLWRFAPPLIALLNRWSWTRRLANFAEDTRDLITAGWHTVATVALTAVGHLIAGLAIYALARAYGAEPPLVYVIMLTNAIFLVSAIPLTVAGWGVREQAMAFFLGMIGIGKAVAVSVSITFGLIMIAIALPGLVLWWVRPRHQAGDPSMMPQAGT